MTLVRDTSFLKDLVFTRIFGKSAYSFQHPLCLEFIQAQILTFLDRGFTRNPNVYHDPTTFNPDRFLASEGHIPERDPHMLVFGFGRRACPGRTLADSNIFLTIAQTLAVFNISRPIRDGKPQKLEAKFLPATISHAAPYEVSIQPRSAEHRELIQSLERDYPWEPSSASLLEALGEKE